MFSRCLMHLSRIYATVQKSTFMPAIIVRTLPLPMELSSTTQFQECYQSPKISKLYILNFTLHSATFAGGVDVTIAGLNFRSDLTGCYFGGTIADGKSLFLLFNLFNLQQAHETAILRSAAQSRGVEQTTLSAFLCSSITTTGLTTPIYSLLIQMR